MKDIEKKYQQLIKDIEREYQQLIKDKERAYDNVCDTFKYHINILEKFNTEKDEEIEKLKGGNKLQKEIDKYNHLEAQKNTNLEDEITKLKAELADTKSELKTANDTGQSWEDRFYTLVKAYGIDLNKPVKADAVVHHCGEGEPKIYKPKTRKRSKTVVAHCKDCGAYFQAKSKLAMYCSKCKKEHAKKSRVKWLDKQKEQK